MVFLVTDQNYHSAGDGKVLEFALLLNRSHDSTVYIYIFSALVSWYCWAQWWQLQPGQDSQRRVWVHSTLGSGEKIHCNNLEASEFNNGLIFFGMELAFLIPISIIIGISFKYLFNNLPKLLYANENFHSLHRQ